MAYPDGHQGLTECQSTRWVIRCSFLVGGELRYCNTFRIIDNREPELLLQGKFPDLFRGPSELPELVIDPHFFRESLRRFGSEPGVMPVGVVDEDLG
jgi:hypothetical protein